MVSNVKIDASETSQLICFMNDLVTISGAVSGLEQLKAVTAYPHQLLCTIE